jgi:hypothetical protein
MSRGTKKVLLISLFALTVLVAGRVHAVDEDQYQVLAPLPGVANTTCTNSDGVSVACTDVSSYITGFFKLVISLSAVLAVIMIIYGGFKYISSAAEGGKTDGKKYIQNAVWGLLLVISSYVVLHTINPDLVNFSLSLENAGTNTKFQTNANGDVVVDPNALNGAQWYDDASYRSQIKAPLSVNKSNCQTIGQTNCTSVYDLNKTIIPALNDLAKKCSAADKSCSVVITGGTEYWLHGHGETVVGENSTHHKPATAGGYAVDISANAALTAYIEKVGQKLTPPSNCPAEGIYNLNGGRYVLNDCGEMSTGTHWHVEFH